MSNIYIQEPPTNGKVLLVTSVGDIDIELWSKEAPKACRNFVQLCMEGYYDGTIFHRVVKDFIAQGGDPSGTGTGGESIYGAPFKDEFHQRLRFVRRGLVAMANAGPHDNASQFFFTMGMTPELQGKHTIFGKVVGDTLFNMLKLQDVETDGQDKPLYPPYIIRSEILSNPFDDIIPRITKKKKEKDQDKKNKSKSKATKNFSLLSFGEEAEEDEEQVSQVSKKFNSKGKSSHDLTDDPRLSSVPVLEVENEETSGKRKAKIKEKEANLENVKSKLKKEEAKPKPESQKTSPKPEKTESKEEAKKNRSEEIRKEAKKLQKEIKASKKRVEAMKQGAADKQEVEKQENDEEGNIPDEAAKPADPSDFLESFKQERQKYKNLKKQQKGGNREEQTLAMLKKFQSKLSSVRQIDVGYSDSEGEEKDEDNEDDLNNPSWMRHTLLFDDPKKRKVIDANVDDNERFEIHDPRNPMTKRRREESKKKSKPR